jgi:hypothetical protein
MDDSLARALGSGEGVPIEPPEERPATPVSPSRARWTGLAAFAIVGASGILVISGLGEVQAVGSVDHAWRDRLQLEVPITDGPPASSQVYAVKIDGLPALGRSDAKVTLVAVTDYTCTSCEVTHSIIGGLRGAYGDDLRIVWKPIAREPRSTPALVGACAAALQGELERYDRAIWRLGPERLPDAANPSCASELSGCREVIRTARDLGLDAQRFASAMKRCAATVSASQRELATMNIHDRAYFVNGRMVDPWGLELAGTFQNLIDVELAKARRRIAAGATPERYYDQWVLDVGTTR